MDVRDAIRIVNRHVEFRNFVASKVSGATTNRDLSTTFHSLRRNSSKNQRATTNPANSRDNYVLTPGTPVTPNPPLINKPDGRSTANFTEV
jgi:hypothetical protein